MKSPLSVARGDNPYRYLTGLVFGDAPGPRDAATLARRMLARAEMFASWRSWVRRRLPGFACCCALLLPGGPVGAQEPPEEIAEETFEEETSIYVVEVPVRVLFKGEPLRDLVRKDFEILDDGERREIIGFEVIDVIGSETGSAVTADLREPAGDESASAAPQPSGRNYLLLFDFAYGSLGMIDARRRLTESVEAAVAMVESGLAPGDRVAVAFYSPLRGFKQMIDFTTDRQAALFALHGIELILEAKPKLIQEEFDGWIHLGPSLPGYRAKTPLGPNRASLDDLVTEARIFLQRGDPFLWHGLIIKHFAWGLREFTEENDLPGMNHIILFSRGPLYGDEQNRSLFYLQELFRDLRQEGWSIEAVNTGGLGFGRDSLALLTSATGGTLHTNSRDIELLLTEAVQDTRVSYILTFQVADLPEDGTYHKLEVRLVDGPKRAKITHRPGYYAPGAIDPKWRRSMAPVGSERSTDYPALTGLDPVSLVETFEVEGRKPREGREDLYLIHDGFRYLFADERNLERFLADSDRYSIRNDGCPVLEGVQGDPDHYHVLDGAIYIFSSASAARKFRNRPERYLPGSVDRTSE